MGKSYSIDTDEASAGEAVAGSTIRFTASDIGGSKRSPLVSPKVPGNSGRKGKSANGNGKNGNGNGKNGNGNGLGKVVEEDGGSEPSNVTAQEEVDSHKS